MTMRVLCCLTLLTVLIAVNDYVKAKKLYVQLPPDVPGGEPRYVKAPKVMTEYDKCKMECKRQRNASHRKEQITSLREQLAILEAEEAAAASDIKESMVRQQESHTSAKETMQDSSGIQNDNL
ncbi:hypothetical protein V3C99_008322 [Haemonchus contortus]